MRSVQGHLLSGMYLIRHTLHATNNKCGSDKFNFYVMSFVCFSYLFVCQLFGLTVTSRFSVQKKNISSYRITLKNNINSCFLSKTNLLEVRIGNNLLPAKPRYGLHFELSRPNEFKIKLKHFFQSNNKKSLILF